MPIYDKLKFVAVNITKKKKKKTGHRTAAKFYHATWLCGTRCRDFGNPMILYCVQESKCYLRYDIIL